jgi:hypothetical protein
MGLIRKLFTYGALFILAYSMGRCSAVKDYREELENCMQSTPAAYYSENLPDTSKIDWNDFLKYDASKETIDEVIEGL